MCIILKHSVKLDVRCVYLTARRNKVARSCWIKTWDSEDPKRDWGQGGRGGGVLLDMRLFDGGGGAARLASNHVGLMPVVGAVRLGTARTDSGYATWGVVYVGNCR